MLISLCASGKSQRHVRLAEFVDRQVRSTASQRDAIAERLAAKDALILFPEGTSGDGNRVLPFKSALMGAVEATVGDDGKGRVKHVLVQPVSTAYVGLHGMPRRVYTYPAEMGWGTLNTLSTIGALLIAVSLLIYLINVVKSLVSVVAV